MRCTMGYEKFSSMLFQSEMWLPVLFSNDKGHLVEFGEPNTWDVNNGTVVVYDQKGWPWVRQWCGLASAQVDVIVKMFNIKRGAYVPHSNDGGRFIRENYMRTTV